MLWYYKPEDVIGGRQSWHGEKELFAQPITGLTNKNPIDSIEGACRVHTLDEYERLEEIGENDVSVWMLPSRSHDSDTPHPHTPIFLSTNAQYFWRFEYNPLKKGTVKPDQVPVYGVCELPYNPDKPMIECAICKEWFHWECVGYFREAHAEGLEPYVCKECEHQKKDEDGDETQ